MNRIPFAILCVLGAAAGACSSSGEAVSTEESNVGSYPATHCELFVDRASPFFTSHGVVQLTLYLKTPLDKFESWGGVKSVGLHAQLSENGGRAGAFSDIVAVPFSGAQDYWQIRFDLQSDFTPTRVFRGAFYVETKSGTRLWVNAVEGGKNFVIDPTMAQNLSKLRSVAFFATHGNSGPDKGIRVADEFPYLNPSSCR